jgi:hypothetical protein
VEQFNCNLKAALTIYHHFQHTRWDENLPSLAIAFNTVWHESTGAPPASLFLGREMNHPLGLKWVLHELVIQRDAKGMGEFWEAALANLKRARARVAARYDVGRRRGSSVWRLCFGYATSFEYPVTPTLRQDRIQVIGTPHHCEVFIAGYGPFGLP